MSKGKERKRNEKKEKTIEFFFRLSRTAHSFWTKEFNLQEKISLWENKGQNILFKKK